MHKFSFPLGYLKKTDSAKIVAVANVVTHWIQKSTLCIPSYHPLPTRHYGQWKAGHTSRPIVARMAFADQSIDVSRTVRSQPP